MWSQLVLCLFVGLAYASVNPGWKENTEYVYMVRGRTLASLHEVSNQYSGILLKAKLRIQSKPDGKLQGQITDAHYSQVHTHLQQWDTYIPDAELSWKTLEMSNEPFQVEMKGGVITDVTVSKNLSNWEANLIRSILSQFQVNTSESNSERSSNHPDSAVYTTMEDTVTGHVETFYRINPLPDYVVMSEPWGQQAFKLKGDSEIIEIMKHKNYTNNIELPVYSHGFRSSTGGLPGTNSMGTYFVRDATSRIIVSGSLRRYTIHHSVTVNKIMANPTLQDKQKGSVHSLMNVTLEQMKDIDQPIGSVPQPIRLGNLVYSYGSPFAHEDRVSEKSSYQQMKRKANDKTRMMREFRWGRSLESGEDNEYEYNENSEESYKKNHPRIEDAPETPLIPFSVGYRGLSIKKAINVVETVKTLSQEIAYELQEPSRNLQETLSKFTILGSLMRTLSAEEMQKAASELYSNDEEGPRRDSWQVFRDVVADCGTGPALLTIKDWIQAQKLKNTEAAAIFATMIRSVRHPTKEYMKTAFELVKSNQVQSEWPLNSTALLSYSDLVHKIFVNQEYYEKLFPTKSFKHFNGEEGKKFVKETIIPYYTEQLHEAVSRAETRKIHAYIMALGNIGHPKILRAFEPYLEGKKQVSQFQRLYMILALDRLAFNYPKQTRDVLFKVYQNTGEMEAVRAAAVLGLMITQPKPEMLQYMASYTNVDVHEHVNAVVKNAIEQISQAKGDHLHQYRAAAAAAKPLLTKKVYGMHYNFNKFFETYLPESDLQNIQQMLLMGYSDSYIPQVFRLSSNNYLKGKYETSWNVAGGVQSVKELIHVLELQTKDYRESINKQRQNFDQQKQNPWSSQHIASVLDLEASEREQLEGSLLVGFNAPLGDFAYDNNTIEQITKELGKYENELRQGKKVNFIKLVNNGPFALSFPTEMGLPFLFTRESPLLFRAKGTFKATANPQVSQDNKIRKPEKIEIKSDVAITLSGKRQGQLSFVTPFDHHQYIAGYDKNWQVFVPVTGDIEVDVKDGQIKGEFEACKSPEEPSLFQYATQPYTSRIDITKLQPVSAQPNTHPIEQSNIRVYDKIFGERETGLALRVQMRHERQFIDTPKMMKLFKEGGIMASFMGLWNDAEIQQSQFNLTHVVPKSTTRKLVITLGQQEEYYRSGDSSREQSSDYEKPEERQREAMKKAAAGIKNVRSQVYDASVEFKGEQNIKYQITGAFAKSNVDPKSRILVELKKKSDKQNTKPYLVSFEAKNEVPNTNGLDLEYSMQTEPKVDSEMQVLFGENYQTASKIHANWQFRRSEERKQFLREQPFYRQCQREQQQGNKQSAPCINMTIESNFLDRAKAQVQFENLKPELEEIIKTVYYGLRLESLFSAEVDSEERSGSQNQIKMNVNFDSDLRSVNISVKTPEDTTSWKNIGIDEWTRQVTVLHPVYHLRSRLFGKILRVPSYRPSCVVDRSQVKTFNNLTFPAEISKEWTVMMQYMPREARHEHQQNSMERQLRNQVENYVVLVRQSEQSSEKKDLKITLSTPETDYKVIDVTMTPDQSGNSKAKVTVNGQHVQISDKESYDIKKGYVQIYALPNGEIKMEVKDAFYVIYDGETMRIVPSTDKFKKAIKGICGQFTNNKFEDVITASECYVHDFSKFVTSYEIDQEGRKMREELSKDDKECARKDIPLYVNVINLEEEQTPGRCSFFQTRYIEQNGNICFTTKSIPACKSGCQPQGTVTKNVPVHCIPSTPVALLWKNQIDQGANPDFSHKKETSSVPMQLPQSCVE